MSNQSDRIQFLQEILGIYGTGPYGCVLEDNRIVTQDTFIQLMADRLMEGKTSLIPYSTREQMLWLLLSPDQRTLRQDSNAISSFIKPYCTNFQQDRREFDPEKPLGRVGYRLFPQGYFVFTTSRGQEREVRDKIRLWEQLDRRRPELKFQSPERNVYQLRQEFEEALALDQWDKAGEILEMIRQGRVLDVVNTHFLTLRLLESRGKWIDIWESDLFDDVSGLDTIPLRIRRLLLTAYHRSVLDPLECQGDYQSAQLYYQETRHRLRTLTRFHMGLEHEQAMSIFLYESAFLQDREALKSWREKGIPTQHEVLYSYLIQQIEESLVEPDNETVLPAPTPLEQSRVWIQQQEFDKAYKLLQQQPTSVEKVGMLCWLAEKTEADPVYLKAYEDYEELSESDKMILQEDPSTKALVKVVRLHVEGVVKSNVGLEDHEDSWNRWWHDLLRFTYESTLMYNRLEKLQKDRKQMIWTDSIVTELTDVLAELAVDDALSVTKTNLLKKAIPSFLTWLLEQRDFPADAAIQVYEYVTEMMVRCNKSDTNGWLMLKMVEGLMEQDKDMNKVSENWKRVDLWLNQVNPRRDMVKYVMATLELFEDCGLEFEKLANLWDRWSASLLKSFAKTETPELSLWYELGTLIGGGESLLDNVKAILDSRVVDDGNIVGELPDMRIVIFTLRDAPAKRAIERLMRRNPRLKIDVCTDTQNTTQAESNSRNADVVVLVTDAMKHALYYGIRKHLQEDRIVYPNSTGMTGIVTALEEYFKKRGA